MRRWMYRWLLRPPLYFVLFLLVLFYLGYFLTAIAPGYYVHEVPFISREMAQEVLGDRKHPRRTRDKMFCESTAKSFDVTRDTINVHRSYRDDQLTAVDQEIFENIDRVLFRDPLQDEGNPYYEYRPPDPQAHPSSRSHYQSVRPNVLQLSVAVTAFDLGFFKLADIVDVFFLVEKDGTLLPLGNVAVVRSRTFMGWRLPKNKGPSDMFNFFLWGVSAYCFPRTLAVVRYAPDLSVSYRNGRFYSYKQLGDDPRLVLRSLY